MLMTNYFCKYYFVAIISIFSLYSEALIGQVSTIDSLKNSVLRDENYLSKLKFQKSDISNIFNQINNKIYSIKLKKSNDPITRIEFDKYLKESNLYADILDSINSSINRTLSILDIKYNSIITKLDVMILIDQDEFKNETDAQKKINVFDMIQQLENEKQKYQDLVNRSFKKMDLAVPLNIEPNDSFENIKLKIDIINDRIHFANEERFMLLNKQNELRSELSVYQDMIDFMADLRLSIDEEQDFYDRDRVNQLHYHVREINKELSDIEIKLKTIEFGKNLILEKLKEFNKYLNMLLKPSNKSEK